MKSIPTIYELKDLFFDKNFAFEYVLNKGFLYETMICPKCNTTMSRNILKKKFRCNIRGCRKEISIFKHSFFDNINLEINHLLYLGNLKFIFN